jgi:protoheme IX farnesyltransferase
VGAVAGAMPVLMGWSAVEGRFGLAVATLFVIVFLWQFPHFMAIAWIYRRQYAAAGMQMLSVVDPTGRRAGVQAVLAALALVPVSALPAVVSFAGPAYFFAALVLSLGQLACAAWFLLRMNEDSARLLLRASLVYLPALLAGLMIGPLT